MTTKTDTICDICRNSIFALDRRGANPRGRGLHREPKSRWRSFYQYHHDRVDKGPADICVTCLKIITHKLRHAPGETCGDCQ